MEADGTRRSRLKKLGRRFFEQSAIDLAAQLIGKVLVRRHRGREYRARIVETEAYLGPQDLASHSSKGRTRRTEVMSVRIAFPSPPTAPNDRA